MSLPLIPETAAEVHRLAISGSGLAAGDYRLKKLVPQLEALAAKAPIYGRIATSINAIVDEKDAAASGRMLLDLASLLTAIRYTQSPHEVKGDFAPLTSSVEGWNPTFVSHRSLSAVIEALTQSGPGRLETIRDAFERKLFADLRLMQPAVEALGASYGEVSEYVARHVVPAFGPPIIPLLLEGFDPKGGKSHARRVTALCQIDPERGRAFCREILENATKEVKLAVFAGLTGSLEDLEAILDLTRERSADIRRSAIRALQGIDHPKVRDFVRNQLGKKDFAEVAAVAMSIRDEEANQQLLQEARRVAESIRAAGGQRKLEAPQIKQLEAECERLMEILQVTQANPEAEWRDFVCGLAALPFRSLPVLMEHTFSIWLFAQNREDLDQILLREPAHPNPNAIYSFQAALRRLSPRAVFDRFAHHLKVKKGREDDPVYRFLVGRYYGSLDGAKREDLCARLDRAWLQEAIRCRVTELVMEMAAPGDRAARDYFLGLSDKEFLVYGLAEKIMAIAPEDAPEIMIKLVTSQNKSSFSHHTRHSLQALGLLPESLIPKIEAMKSKIPEDLHGEIEGALAQIRFRASQGAS